VIGQRRQDDGTEPKRRPSAPASPPTSKMIAFAQRLARDKKAALPPDYDKDFDICRRFLDQNLAHFIREAVRRQVMGSDEAAGSA
jgi:hypothetical protein